MENVNFANNKCHDCGLEMIEDNGEIKNGYQVLYKDNDGDINIFKCKECYQGNTALSNFRKCEVYSRVVGYIRPVQQWNMGKKQEYAERKEFIEN